MAITYTISREERLIKAFATGIIRADDLHGLIGSLLADPAFVPGLRGLYDARYAEPAGAEAWLENNGGDEAGPGARGRRQDLDPH